MREELKVRQLKQYLQKWSTVSLNLIKQLKYDKYNDARASSDFSEKMNKNQVSWRI